MLVWVSKLAQVRAGLYFQVQKFMLYKYLKNKRSICIYIIEKRRKKNKKERRKENPNDFKHQPASAGNRARVTSMATMYSATRPLMLCQRTNFCASFSDLGAPFYPLRRCYAWEYPCTKKLVGHLRPPGQAP